MKKILFYSLSILLFTACGNDAKNGSTNLDPNVIAIQDGDKPSEAKFKFDKLVHDFGTIQEGTKVEHTFKFTNDGTAPLLIQGCKSSCGCTIPVWPREAIAPGEKGEIKVQFDSKGKSDIVTKNVNIQANTTPAMTTLIIKTFVEKTPTE